MASASSAGTEPAVAEQGRVMPCASSRSSSMASWASSRACATSSAALAGSLASRDSARRRVRVMATSRCWAPSWEVADAPPLFIGGGEDAPPGVAQVVDPRAPARARRDSGTRWKRSSAIESAGYPLVEARRRLARNERLEAEPGDPGRSVQRVDRRDPIVETVKASTATGTPSSVATRPAAPSTIAGCAARLVAKNSARVATARAPSTTCNAPPPSSLRTTTSGSSTASSPSKSPSRAAARNAVDDPPVGGGRAAVRAVDAAPRPGRQLPRGRRRPVDDQRDVPERHREQVVEHERQALAVGLAHDEQRGADRVGRQRLRLRVWRAVSSVRVITGSGSRPPSSASSRRRLRASSIVRHTRETTGSSATSPRLSTRGCRRGRSGSTPWSASSASAREPRIRVATA